MKKYFVAVLVLLALLASNEYLLFRSSDEPPVKQEDDQEAMATSINLIKNNPQAREALLEAMTDLDITLAAIQQENSKIVASLFRLRMPANQIALVQRQALLIERMGRSIDRSVTAGSTSRLPPSFELNSKRFQAVLQGMAQGDRELMLSPATDVEVRKSLGIIGELFAEVPRGAMQVLEHARVVNELEAAADTLAQVMVDAQQEQEEQDDRQIAGWQGVLGIDKPSEGMAGEEVGWVEKLLALLEVNWGDANDRLQIVLAADEMHLMTAREHQAVRLVCIALLLLITFLIGRANMAKITITSDNLREMRQEPSHSTAAKTAEAAAPMGGSQARGAQARGAQVGGAQARGARGDAVPDDVTQGDIDQVQVAQGEARQASPRQAEEETPLTAINEESANEEPSESFQEINLFPLVQAPQPQQIANWMEADGDEKVKQIRRSYQQTLNAVLKREDMRQNLKVLCRLLTMLAKQGGESPLGNLALLAAAVAEGIEQGAIRLDGRSANLLRLLDHHFKKVAAAGGYGLCTSVDEELALGLLELIQDAVSGLEADWDGAGDRLNHVIAAQQKFLA